MSYYDDSSLFVAPNGYKTSVLFAQKPMDANGQLAFTRSNSTATRVGPDGLIEKVRTNLLLQSNTFDTTWTATSAILTSGQTGYDGTSNAWLLSKVGYNGRIQQGVSQSGVQTFSVYAKKGDSDYIRLYVDGAVASVYFNLTDGSIHSGSSYIDAKTTDMGGGWYRCEMTFEGSSTLVRIYPAEAGTTAGSETGSVYIQDAQLEAGDIATDYIPTTTTAVSVGPVANLPRIDYTGGGCGKLLLEPQRTNLLLYSEQLNNSYWFKGGSGAASAPVVTANYAISPDGYQNADRVYFDAVGTSSADRSSLIRDFAFTTGQTYTISGYAKSATGANQILQFRIAGAQAGGELTATSEWQRFSVTYTATTSTTDNFGIQLRGNNTETTSDLLLYGLQLELASYATSYIGPTLGSASTRGADSCIKTGISSLIGQTEGTLFLDFDYNQPTSDLNGRLLQVYGTNDTTDAILPLIYGFGSDVNEFQLTVFSAAAASVVIPASASTVVPFGRQKFAIAYNAGVYTVYRNGSLFASGSGLAPVSLTAMDLGSSSFLARNLGNPINQALLFKTRLSNSELASLTTL